MTEENQLTPTQSFEQKMADRIRADIGDLMPDEKLAEMVERVINKSFMEPVQIPSNSWPHSNQYQPPELENVIRSLMKDSVNNAVADYIAKNPEPVNKVIELVFQAGVDKAIIRSLANLFEPDFMLFEASVRSTIHEMRQNGEI